MTKFKVALIQLNSQRDVDGNISTLQRLVSKAADQGVDLILTPENLASMPMDQQTPAFAVEKHPMLAAARDLAQKYSVWLLLGSLLIKDIADGKIYNRSILLDNHGQVVSFYDKIHLFDVNLGRGESYGESAYFRGGNKAIIVETPWCKLGMTICYDLRFPHLYRSLAQAGAECILVPSAFTATTGKVHWEVLLRARAIENGCFIFAPNQAGDHAADQKTYGHSTIINPWGEVVAVAGEAEDIIVSDIDVSASKRARERIPSLICQPTFDLAVVQLTNSRK